MIMGKVMANMGLSMARKAWISGGLSVETSYGIDMEKRAFGNDHG